MQEINQLTAAAAAEQPEPKVPGFATGGGEMGRLIRSIDWSDTPLGPIDTWPQSLRTTVSLVLSSNFPISMAWGPHHVQIYNDGYWPICGGKHPGSMGQDFRECWASAWPVIGEAYDRALSGESQYLENQRMFLDRNGYLEETFFTFSFSPIRDESGGIGGLFHPVTETTVKMLSERRTQALRELGSRTAEAKTVAESLSLTAETLSGYELDLPFVLFYEIDGRAARLAGSAGLPPDLAATPTTVDLDASSATPWPLAEVVDKERPMLIEDLQERFGGLLCGPYPEGPKLAQAVPIIPPGADRPVAVMIAAASSRLPFNNEYRNFFALLASGVTGAVANALAHELERQRAEALAEIDRAKTLFFSNVSHEFRTPLTLMLGPLADALEDPTLTPETSERIDLAQRNGVRLMKLVNTLLDFSRIEAGRAEACFVPTDLATVTADLASNFRSACDRAGLRLIVDCGPLDEPAYVDRDMWEKIVLNLVSNAFKFTFEGEIEVGLKVGDGKFELVVRDTGVGIPEAELPKIFDRFHRVAETRGRTFEGTGIGLSLIRELVSLHAGAVRVESRLGEGTRFVVEIPTGSRHLPADRIGAAPELNPTSIDAKAFVEEALRWLPDGDAETTMQSVDAPDAGDPAAAVQQASDSAEGREVPRILWADDNADMRAYVTRLLESRYLVEAVADGETALAAARANPPALVVTDVMMPKLDGFGLLAAMRRDPALRSVPVIMLSARAGEEARVEGLEAGASDYLVKPFSARELLARVEAQLAMDELRRAVARSEEFQRKILESSQDCIKVLDLDGRLQSINGHGLQALEFSCADDAIGANYLEWWSGDDRAVAEEAVQQALAGGAGRFTGYYRMQSGRDSWWDEMVTPIADADGRPESLLVISRDITERKLAERRHKLLLDELNHRVKNTLATVQSIALQTLKGSAPIDAERSAFQGRLIALSKLHNLLVQDHWESASLRDIVTGSLSPYGDGETARFTVDGPDIRLIPKVALALGMAIHELATNAAKYGALSNDVGCIEIAWKLAAASGSDRLHLSWRESGGPAVQPPSGSGFGSVLIKRGLAHDLGGDADLIFDPVGVRCTIDMPVRGLA